MKIKCDVIRDLLPLYVDDVLSEESRKLVEEHLQECEDCREYCKDLKETGEDPVRTEFAGEMAPLKKIRRREIFNRVALIAVILAFVGAAIALLGHMGISDSWMVEDHADYTVPEGYELEGKYYDDTMWVYVRETDKTREKLKITCEDHAGVGWMKEEEISVGNGWKGWLYRWDVDHSDSNALSGILDYDGDYLLVEYSCQVLDKENYYDSCSKDQEKELTAFLRTFHHKDPPPTEGNFFQRLWENLGLIGIMAIGFGLLILVGMPIAAVIGSMMKGRGEEKETGPVSSAALHEAVNRERKAKGESEIPAINNVGSVSTNNLARRDKSWSSVPDFFIKMIRRK